MKAANIINSKTVSELHVPVKEDPLTVKRDIHLETAICQVEQAQALLSMWMELGASDDREHNLIGSLMTLLASVPETMQKAVDELVRQDYIISDIAKLEVAAGAIPITH